jgi:hypothetical protein
MGFEKLGLLSKLGQKNLDVGRQKNGEKIVKRDFPSNKIGGGGYASAESGKT